MAADQVFTVRGDAELVTRAGHLFTSVRQEFVCAARDPDTWSLPAARQVINNNMQATGLDVSKLLSPAALADEAARLHLHEVASKGVHVRISSTPLPHETIIIDRRVMILAGRDRPGPREYTVTTSPTLVGGVYALFQAAWETATDLADFLHGDAPHLDADSLAVLRALGAGHTDETAARQLGLSLRTYRRRVAELMTKLEAASRFQAGLRVGELRLNS
ncbi:LuxR family transcriptional regulator [Herbidospora mongoliensis]|uniref:LuxR family transcriptional regulator n=1 Tax=Herbidospora mongoliensis TaxID=688067 RepID=UPI00082CF4EC|nr:LuxR family transcriptional regulator [Herbidospora mongoliensis]